MQQAKQAVAGVFGRASGGYDRAGFLGEIARRLVAHAHVGAGMRVLDVGCGSGAAASEAARLAGPGGLVVAVDLAAPMVVQAARRLGGLGDGAAAAAVAVVDAEQPAFCWPASPRRLSGSAVAGAAPRNWKTCCGRPARPRSP